MARTPLSMHRHLSNAVPVRARTSLVISWLSWIMLSFAVSFRSAPVPVAVPAAEGEAGRDRPAKPTSRDAQTTAVATKPVVRQRPAELCPKLQKAKKQHGNQRRPNLGLNRIGTGADKGLDLAQLLSALKNSSTCHLSL